MPHVPSVPNYLHIDLLPQQKVARLRRKKDSLPIEISPFSNNQASKPRVAAVIKDGRGALECQTDVWRGKFGGVGSRAWVRPVAGSALPIAPVGN